MQAASEDGCVDYLQMLSVSNSAGRTNSQTLLDPVLGPVPILLIGVVTCVCLSVCV